jgi:hypothetical protein
MPATNQQEPASARSEPAGSQRRGSSGLEGAKPSATASRCSSRVACYPLIGIKAGLDLRRPAHGEDEQKIGTGSQVGTGGFSYQDRAASSHSEDGVFLLLPRRSWRGSFLPGQLSAVRPASITAPGRPLPLVCRSGSPLMMDNLHSPLACAAPVCFQSGQVDRSRFLAPPAPQATSA